MTVQKERRRVAARRSAHRRNREGPKAPACSLTLTPVRPARPRPGWQGIETARWAQGISQRPQDRERSLEAQFDVYLSNWGSIPGTSSLIRRLSESPSSLDRPKILNSICPIPAGMA